jgi:NitT/TauT family transport system substrate-binding protein
MPQQPSSSRRQFLATSAGAAALVAAPWVHAQTASTAPIDLKFSLDWRFQGVHAGWMLAADKGYFREEGLNVQIDAGDGSAGVVQRIVSGAYQAGIGDTNTTKQLASTSPDTAPLSVYMVFNRAPFVILSKKSKGITKPADLAGKTVLATANSSALRMFPAFARANGLDMASVKFQNVAPQMMDPMLVRDEADALAGFLTTAAINIRALGQNLSDYNMMFFTDHGVDSYGNSLLVSRKLATENPKAVAGLVRAANRGWLDAVANPAEGVAAVLKRDPILKTEIELERLQLGLRELILTPEARAVGLGDVETARFERAIRNVAQSFELQRAPAKGEVFSRAFLPPAAQRTWRA